MDDPHRNRPPTYFREATVAGKCVAIGSAAPAPLTGLLAAWLDLRIGPTLGVAFGVVVLLQIVVATRMQKASGAGDDVTNDANDDTVTW